MQRPIWKGHISFALVSIPVTLYSAEIRTDLHFHMLDSRNKARVHYERVNDETGKEVPWNEVVKAYEFDKNDYVILEDEDFKRAAPKAVKSIDIQDFVDIKNIDYRYFERPYYLVPDKSGEKGYVLLREALYKSEKVGIAKVVIRAKQYLAAVMPYGDALILNLLRFTQELRNPDEFNFPDKSLKNYNITEREMELASQLINSMASQWKPERYHDEYREALLKWIEEKSTHKAKHIRKEKTEPNGKVINFMEALKSSLEKTKKTTKAKKPKSTTKKTSEKTAHRKRSA